jgi:IS5 family transposase
LLWFLGLDLDSEIPDHSVLSKARARWGAEVFEKLFVTSVKQCVEAGLVNGRLLHVDSTMVKANAHGDSVVTSSPELVQALREAYQQQESKLEVLPAATLLPAVRPQPAPAPESPAAERAPELQVLPRPAQPVTVVAAGRQGEATPETKPAGQKLPVNITHISTTDPTAELARSKNGLKDLNYKEHRLVDDAHGVITAVATTRANVADGVQLPELYEQHVVTTGMVRAGVTVAGDHHYGTADNYIYCAEQGMRAHLGPYQAHVQERGQLPPSRFVYEAKQDRLRCPEGHYLELHQHRPEQHEKVYEMKHPAVCAGCPRRPICTKSKRGRSIRRHEQAELVQAARAQAHSEAGRYSRRRRQHVMEGTFADAANNHGAKQARWRGLGRQKIQSWIIAAVQNLRRLVRHQAGRGPVGAAVGVWGRSAMVLPKVLGQIPGPVQRRAGSGRRFLPYRYGLSLAQAATAALRACN